MFPFSERWSGQPHIPILRTIHRAWYPKTSPRKRLLVDTCLLQISTRGCPMGQEANQHMRGGMNSLLDRQVQIGCPLLARSKNHEAPRSSPPSFLLPTILSSPLLEPLVQQLTCISLSTLPVTVPSFFVCPKSTPPPQRNHEVQLVHCGPSRYGRGSVRSPVRRRQGYPQGRRRPPRGQACRRYRLQPRIAVE